MGVAPWVHHLPPLGKREPAPLPANHYITESHRRATRCRYALQAVVEDLTTARERLQVAIRQLELGRLL